MCAEPDIFQSGIALLLPALHVCVWIHLHMQSFLLCYYDYYQFYLPSSLFIRYLNPEVPTNPIPCASYRACIPTLSSSLPCIGYVYTISALYPASHPPPRRGVPVSRNKHQNTIIHPATGALLDTIIACGKTPSKGNFQWDREPQIIGERWTGSKLIDEGFAPPPPPVLRCSPPR